MFRIEEVYILKMESEPFSETSAKFYNVYTVLRKKKRYCNLKNETLDCTVWRTRFGIIIIIIFINCSWVVTRWQ